MSLPTPEIPRRPERRSTSSSSMTASNFFLEIAAARTHDHPAGWGQSHAGVDRFAPFDGGDTCAIRCPQHLGPDDPEVEAFAWDVQVGMRSTILDDFADDRAKFNRLLKDADVFFANKRPGFLERNGLGAEELCAKKPGHANAVLRRFAGIPGISVRLALASDGVPHERRCSGMRAPSPAFQHMSPGFHSRPTMRRAMSWRCATTQRQSSSWREACCTIGTNIRPYPMGSGMYCHGKAMSSPMSAAMAIIGYLSYSILPPIRRPGPPPHRRPPLSGANKTSGTAHFTSMTFASPRRRNKLRVTSLPCRWSLRSMRELPRLNWFKIT
jgi:CoA-transferase family III